MQLIKVVELINKRYPYAGSLLWTSSVQFLVVQFIVALNWPYAYSTNNTISDLGGMTCGIQFDRYICSPWHTWFNVSVIILGITMILGSLLLYQQVKKAHLAFILMSAGGFGTILVGLFPLGTSGLFHGFGAFLPFFIGNISLVLFSYMLPMPKWLQRCTLFAGIMSLIAFALFVTNTYLGLGVGVMERITAHLQTIWLTIFGLFTAIRLYRKEPILPKSS